MAARKKPGKGSFSDLHLPVAKEYPARLSRNRMVWLAAAVGLLVLGFAAFNLTVQHGGLLSNGPLSSNHANLESDCAACHTSSVTDEACSTCHEKFGDKLGVYNLAAHYLYRTTDFQRLSPREGEPACFGCHVEHLGRDAEITRVPDSRCISCHQFGSFNARHPEFDAVAEGHAPQSGLSFNHVPHVGRLMERLKISEVERVCLTCHNPQPDGKQFEPIRFDRHCDTCHLTTAVKTPWLPLQGEDGGYGVESLETIQRRGGPDADWAFYTSPSELTLRGPSVSKGPLYHQDPWVMDNLRRLRRILYPDSGLADLLRASADAPADESRRLYREALDTLEHRARGLRSRPEPEVQQDLARIEEVLAGLRQRLEDPYAPLDETKFDLALGSPAANLSADQAQEIDTLIADLTQPCRQCHRVENATIVRVRSDLRTFTRAEFNHRAHILQRRCLDCHTEIPILEHLGTTEAIDPSLDNAAIQNLPGIARCQECHNSSLASNRCVTCHEFHPAKDRHASLLLYVGGEAPPVEGATTDEGGAAEGGTTGDEGAAETGATGGAGSLGGGSSPGEHGTTEEADATSDAGITGEGGP